MCSSASGHSCRPSAAASPVPLSAASPFAQTVKSEIAKTGPATGRKDRSSGGQDQGGKTAIGDGWRILQATRDALAAVEGVKDESVFSRTEVVAMSCAKTLASGVMVGLLDVAAPAVREGPAAGRRPADSAALRPAVKVPGQRLLAAADRRPEAKTAPEASSAREALGRVVRWDAVAGPGSEAEGQRGRPPSQMAGGGIVVGGIQSASRVRDNEIYNVPYSGISTGLGWGTNDTVAGGNNDYQTRATGDSVPLSAALPPTRSPPRTTWSAPTTCTKACSR